jgi:hypothetical protein
LKYKHGCDVIVFFEELKEKDGFPESLCLVSAQAFFFFAANTIANH